MFTSLFLGIFGALVALSLGISIVSLIIHWKRPEQHPDTARLEQELTAVRTAHLELLDKVEHWMKRDRVRKAREGREAALEAQEAEGQSTTDPKAALWAKVANIRGKQS